MASRADILRAREAAAWVVRSDARLLGIPSVRPIMIEAAVSMAFGPDVCHNIYDVPAAHDEENEAVILEVLDRAAAAAKKAIKSPT